MVVVVVAAMRPRAREEPRPRWARGREPEESIGRAEEVRGGELAPGGRGSVWIWDARRHSTARARSATFSGYEAAGRRPVQAGTRNGASVLGSVCGPGLAVAGRSARRNSSSSEIPCVDLGPNRQGAKVEEGWVVGSRRVGPSHSHSQPSFLFFQLIAAEP